MSYKSRERNIRVVLRVLSLAAIVVGILSLLGVRPMNSRTVEVVLGTASVIGGLVLWGITMRQKTADSISPVDNS
jgi:ascorbate-specific PTS system EIIC-type component UlaA